MVGCRAAHGRMLQLEAPSKAAILPLISRVSLFRHTISQFLYFTAVSSYWCPQLNVKLVLHVDCVFAFSKKMCAEKKLPETERGRLSAPLTFSPQGSPSCAFFDSINPNNSLPRPGRPHPPLPNQILQWNPTGTCQMTKLQARMTQVQQQESSAKRRCDTTT